MKLLGINLGKGTAFICILIISIVITGCSNSGQIKVDEEFQSGSGELQIEFMRNNPPRQVFQNSDISFVIRLTNSGSEFIENGILVIQTDNTIFNILGGNRASFSLQNAGVMFPKGESSIETFRVRVNSLEQESQRVNVDIIASACYAYATRMSAMVCMDVDPFELRPTREGCKGRDISPRTTGAPVHVDKIEVRYNVDGDFITPSYIFSIRHIGRGLLYDKSQVLNFCTSRAVASNIANKISFRVWVSEQELECSTNELILHGGQGRVTCQGQTYNARQILTSFEAPMEIDMLYGYSVSQTQRVEVTR